MAPYAPVYELSHVAGQLLVAALLTGVCRSRSMQLRRASRAAGMVHVATRLLRDSEKRTLAAHFPLFICLLTLWGTWRCQSARHRPRWDAALMQRRPRRRAGELICRAKGNERNRAA